MRLLARTEGGDGTVHCFAIVAAVERDNLVLVLTFVEGGGDRIDPLTIGTTHGVPPLELHPVLGERRTAGEGKESRGRDHSLCESHW